jgi:hypothetical protein
MPYKARERDPDELLPQTDRAARPDHAQRGERHGYGLRQDIVAHTQGRISLEAGNLYRHIRKLQSEGLLKKPSHARSPATTTNGASTTVCSRSDARAWRRMLRLRALMRIAEANRVLAPARA